MSARRAWPIAAAIAIAAIAPACGSDEPSAGATPTSSGTTGGEAGGPPDVRSWTECQASDQAFLRRAMTALLGRRPWSQAEIDVYDDLLQGLRAAGANDSGEAGEGDLEPAKRLVVEAMMRESAYRLRWSDFLMDALHVVRAETKSQVNCYGPPSAVPVDDGTLAAYVRDHDPTANNPPIQDFTMGQLLSSTIELDDLSPLYRAHLFAMLSFPFTAANVGPLELERARRQNFGAVFESAYIHRDLVCLTCHNSEFSVTASDDPAKNRAWPVPGQFERALYGSADGTHPAAEAEAHGTDDLRSRSMLRYSGVADGGGQRAYGLAFACGTFRRDPDDDPLGVDTYFGSVRSTPADPTKGRRASVWDLEAALHRGVDLLAAHGLQRLEGGALADPDEAFAYLVAENIAEEVWNEVMGRRLTIANYFPRTEVQRDILMSLTEHFVASHFSLKTLLLDVLAHPAFNLKAPDEGCGATAYELPPVFDPWTAAEADLARRGNSPADGVFPLSPRPLRRGLFTAMQWPAPQEFPPADELAFQISIGYFIKDGEPGFRGLDFQGRLAWESAYGACANPGDADFVSRLVDQAAATPGATLRDAVVALKDRLTGEAWVDDAVERPALEALTGASLDDTDIADLEPRLRLVCGALVSSPQMMLAGIVPADARDVPLLTPPEADYAAMCQSVGERIGVAEGYVMTCGDHAASVEKR